MKKNTFHFLLIERLREIPLSHRVYHRGLARGNGCCIIVRTKNFSHNSPGKS